MQKVYKLYSAGTSSANAVASVQIARRGRITGVFASAYLTSSGAVGRVATELSFSSVAQTTANDTIGPIAQFESNAAANSNVPMNVALPMNIGVNAGDRIYVNQVASGSPTTHVFQAFLFVEE